MALEKDEFEYVLYSPPKSVAFGHQTRIRDPRRAWVSLEEFLEKWTDGEFRSDGRFVAMLPTPSQTSQVYTEYYWHVRKMLGPETGPHQRTWMVTPEQIPMMLNACFDEDRWPRQANGPAMLSLCFDFKWKTSCFLESGAISGSSQSMPVASRLGVILGTQRVFVQPYLIFLSPWDSPATLQFIDVIEPNTPFRMREQYFQRMLPVKGGFSTYRTRKLKKGWRSDAQQQIQADSSFFDRPTT